MDFHVLYSKQNEIFHITIHYTSDLTIEEKKKILFRVLGFLQLNMVHLFVKSSAVDHLCDWSFSRSFGLGDMAVEQINVYSENIDSW